MSGISTPRKIVEGLGSARHGASVWKAERLSSLLLIPLVLWSLWQAPAIAAGGYEGALAWIREPVNLVLFVTVLVLTLWHMAMGLRVVIEDYVHGALGSALLILNTVFCWGLGLVAAVSILKAVFGIGLGAS